VSHTPHSGALLRLQGTSGYKVISPTFLFIQQEVRPLGIVVNSIENQCPGIDSTIQPPPIQRRRRKSVNVTE